MSTLQLPDASLSSPGGEGEGQVKEAKSANLAISKDDTPSTFEPPSADFSSDATQSARALVRLIQCPQCSLPLRIPITLPCGNSLCRQCLPPTHTREGITYPENAHRQEAIACPFQECRMAHPLEDCSVNVTMLKVMENINLEVAKMKAAGVEHKILVKEIPFPDSEESSEKPKEGQSCTLPGGRLIASFTMAEMGDLPYTSDVTYEDVSPTADNSNIDSTVLQTLKDITHKDLECHVCYSLMLDPVTTPCGHTFCRKCLARILDNASYYSSSLCAVCRRRLPMPSSLSKQPSDKVLVGLLGGLCPDHVAARAAAMEIEERNAPGGLDTPLFVCAVSFPHMPTLLHIFEPRYRLMIRRALEVDRTFGMLMYNEASHSQGELGDVPFMQIGTLLQVEQYQQYPDGRSGIMCKGLCRFKVLRHGVLDGYTIGKIEKLEDISLAEEERIEAEETNRPEGDESDLAGHLDRMSTQELYQICMNFVQRARDQSARWLQGRILDVYGLPPEDPALFPYWFASVIPLRDEEKYRLMPTTSVRKG